MTNAENAQLVTDFLDQYAIDPNAKTVSRFDMLAQWFRMVESI